MKTPMKWVGMMFLTAGVVLGAEAQELNATARPEDRPAVFVTNDAAHAVPVQVAERREPYQHSLISDRFGTERFKTFGFDVPSGKMLIIEMVSISVVVESGQKVKADVSFQGGPELPGNDFFVGHNYLTLERVDGFGPGDLYTTTRSMTGYAGGPDAVAVSITRDSNTGLGGRTEASIIGYLIDVPVETLRDAAVEDIPLR